MKSKIIWFTGLSGSGKTTLSEKISNKLQNLKFKVMKIDGDIFRKKNSNKNKFTKTNIYKNNLSIIKYINKINDNYDFIIVSVISPLIKTRLKAKKLYKKNYIEIYVKCSIKTLIKRDTKGLYNLAIKNQIKNLIGYNSIINYEKSKYKKLIIDTEKKSISQCTKIILKYISK